MIATQTMTVDKIVLDRFTRQVLRQQERVENARTRTDLSPATHDALTRAAQMLSLVAHDLDEAAGGME